ncbi:hypothetical protein AACH10_06555 [Ideonella sp. DXS22W]|uniref:Acyltransferase n=1 Tax=Pseudaquabacterium inlustre TaxID=2984192 RepID=A0ABU9CG39_9BURK
MFTVVAITSDGMLCGSGPTLPLSGLSWLALALLGASSDLNGLRDPGLIACRMLWALSFEQLFYLYLPLLAGFFVIVASGNFLFGAIGNSASGMLGDVSYGICLLHGICLWVAFRMVATDPVAERMTAQQHWWVILAITPALVLAAHLAYRRIERSCLAMTPRLTDWLRSRAAR